MGTLTTAGKNALLDQIGTMGWYVAPFNGNPASGGTELTDQVDGNRQPLDSMAAASNSAVLTAEAFTFTADPSGASITINYVGYFDAETDGTLMAVGTAPERTLVGNETVTYPVGGQGFNLGDPT